MLNWLVKQIGDQAPAVAVIALCTALMSGALTYTIVRDFGIGDEPIQPSEIQQDRQAN